MPHRSRSLWGLLNHLIGARQQRWRNLEPQRLRGAQVDHEIEFRRLLDSEFARLGSSEDPVDIRGGAPIQVLEVRAVADEQAGVTEILQRMERGQAIPNREFGD